MTSLISAFHDLKPQKIVANKLYPAKVIDNRDIDNFEDKLPLGRVKFKIPKIFDDIDDEFLPWAVPHFDRLKGGKNNGTFSVPKKDSKIWVVFQDDDIYNPIYYSYPYVKDEILEILLVDSDDKDEYPKKHIIYSFDSENVYVIYDDYSNDELKYKMYIKNVGNVQIWYGKNYDHYVKDNFDFVVDSKMEIHSIPASTSIIIHNIHNFTAEDDSFSTFYKNQTIQVQGLSDHTYMGTATRSFGDGLIISILNGLMITISDGSPVTFSSEGGEVEIKVDKIKIIGNIEVEGDISATGSIMDEAGNSNHHEH